MSNTKTINIVILTVGALLVAALSIAGCNDHVSTVSHEDGHDHTEKPESPPMQVSDTKLSADADLDLVVEEALANIEKGKASGDMSLVMNEGIMKLRAVNNADSNHLGAIYHLGVFSIESGQLQKALKRFEKLVLLQPENQEYQSKLAEIRTKLN